ncbi:MAG TPA: cytochrome c [Vicinamibacterales bacterium]|nr:cytochrome c [Vicinamibacterales bacterium]
MKFVVGFILGIVVLLAAGYSFVAMGGVSMMTSAAPLPFEQRIAKLALHANLRKAADLRDPLPLNDENLTAGARVYRDSCAVCHGTPGRHSDIAAGMFPQPPQLFTDPVTDDAEGITYWKVTHGIRLSGMPAFTGTLSDTQRWQVTMLLAHADKLSPGVRAVLQ